MDARTSRFAHASAVVVGIATWAVMTVTTHRPDAWNNDPYLAVVLPAIGLFAMAVAALLPERARRWAIAPFAGPAATAIVFAFFGAAACLSAFIGTAIGRRLRGGSPG